MPPVTEELTAEMVSQYCQLINWLLDVHLSEAQKAKVKQILSSYYQKQDKERIRTFHVYLDTYTELAAMPANQRRLHCLMNTPDLLKKMEVSDGVSPEEARFLRQVYFSAHPVYLPGNPHMTVDIMKAWLEIDHFIRQERTKIFAEQKRKLTVPPALPRNQQLKLMKERWYKMPLAERYKFYRLPGELSQVKEQWPTMTQKQKNQMVDTVAFTKNLMLDRWLENMDSRHL